MVLLASILSNMASISSSTVSISGAVQTPDPAIVSAIIGFLGAVLGAAISGVVAYLTVRSTKKADELTTDRMLSSQYITDKRVQWIQDLRTEIAVFAANVKFVLGYSKVQKTAIYEEQIPQSIIEVLRSGRKIQLMLNPKDDKELVDLIGNVLTNIPYAINNSKGGYDKAIKKDIEAILLSAQKTLKDEWERSKQEIREGKA